MCVCIDGTWVCVKATFPALRAKWKHKWATLSIGDKTRELPPNPGNCRSTLSNYTKKTHQRDCFILWILWIVFSRWENSTEIQPVSLACANSGAGLRVSGSATSCWALNMYPVSLRELGGDALRWGTFGHPEAAGTPSAPPDFQKGPWKCCDGGGTRKCPLPWEEVSNWKAPFFHFGEFSSISALAWFGVLMTEHLHCH